MEEYTIEFKFKGKEISAIAHKYERLTFVYFTDSFSRDEFGNFIEFDDKNNFIERRGQSVSKDLPEFISELKIQLK